MNLKQFLGHLQCSSRYNMLKDEIKNMDIVKLQVIIDLNEKYYRNIFYQELKTVLDKRLKELNNG